MILLDALYVNSGGGKVLLDYLIECLEASGLNIFYLLDNRIIGNHPIIKSNKIEYLATSIFKRRNFYKRHEYDFDRVLCFGNLPPNIRLKAEVFTYFQQLLFLKYPDDLTSRQKFFLTLKTLVLKNFVPNTDYWLVQSEQTKKKLASRFKINDEDSIKIIPFYPPSTSNNPIFRNKNSFIYVSSGEAHKNHKRLLEAFTAFYDHYKTGSLYLTIDEKYSSICNLINSYIIKGYPIINYGNVAHKSLSDLYKSAEFSIYPSLAESFGLGIVEAIENGCKIIGADRPYMHAVCKPSVLFNPESIEDMVGAFKSATFNNLQGSKLLVANEVTALMNLFK